MCPDPQHLEQIPIYEYLQSYIKLHLGKKKKKFALTMIESNVEMFRTTVKVSVGIKVNHQEDKKTKKQTYLKFVK